jgi:hypothetical protein
MTPKSKIILTSALILVLVFAIVPKTNAWTEKLLPQYWLLEILQNTVFRFIAIFIALAGRVFDWLINLTGAFTDSLVVDAGWKIMRDLVNMSFIFLLLVIGLGTILGLQNYGSKKLLVNVIIVALLVNFSKLFCKLIIDASQIFTDFFISQSITGQGSLSETIMASLGAAKIHQVNFNFVGEASALLIAVLLNIVVLVGILIVLSMACLLLGIRLIALSLLIIASPVAFLCRILPGTRTYWDRWWKTFINYVFFAPIFAFLLYLALLAPQMAQENLTTMSNESLPGLGSVGNAFFATGDVLLIYLLTLGFLFAAILSARWLSIQWSGRVVGWAQAGIKGFGKWWTGLTPRGAGKAWEKGKEKWTQGMLEEKGLSGKFRRGMEKFGKTTSKLPRWTGVPLLGAAAARQPAKILQRERAVNKQIAEKYKEFTESELRRIWDTLSEREKTVLVEDRAKKHKLAKLKLSTEQLKEIGNNMPKYQLDYKQVINFSPDLAPEITKYYQDNEKEINERIFAKLGVSPEVARDREPDIYKTIIVKHFLESVKPNDFQFINANALDEKYVEEAVLEALKEGGLDKRHLVKLLSSDNSKLIEKVSGIIEKNLSSLPTDIKNYWDNKLLQFVSAPPASS